MLEALDDVNHYGLLVALLLRQELDGPLEGLETVLEVAKVVEVERELGFLLGVQLRLDVGESECFLIILHLLC